MSSLTAAGVFLVRKEDILLEFNKTGGTIYGKDNLLYANSASQDQSVHAIYLQLEPKINPPRIGDYYYDPTADAGVTLTATGTWNWNPSYSTLTVSANWTTTTTVP